MGGVSLIIFTLWFFFGARDDGSTPAAEKAKLYACPMHLWITSDAPSATCPICGMKLMRNDSDSAENLEGKQTKHDLHSHH